MFQIIGFYFGIMSSFFVDIMQEFEIFPGIPYGTWLLGIMLFGTFIAFWFGAIKRDLDNQAYLAVRKNREIRYQQKHGSINDSEYKRTIAQGNKEYHDNAFARRAFKKMKK